MPQRLTASLPHSLTRPHGTRIPAVVFFASERPDASNVGLIDLFEL